MKPGLIRFRAQIQQFKTGGAAAWVDFPKSVEKVFGTKGRVPVRATFDGIPYRGSLVRMGTPKHMLILVKAIREKLNKKGGDWVRVTVALDEKPRVIKLAQDTARALGASASAQKRWTALSFTHQREYHQWIESAKKPETRKRRIAQMVQMLSKSWRAGN